MSLQKNYKENGLKYCTTCNRKESSTSLLFCVICNSCLISITEVENEILYPIEVEIVVLIGGNTKRGKHDGPLEQVNINGPCALLYTYDKELWFSDQQNHAIRKFDREFTTVTTVTGQSIPNGIGNASEPSISYPAGLIDGNDGYIYLADSETFSIRKISKTNGFITTIAGGKAGLQDGDCINAQFKQPWGLTMDKFGDIYVADLSNNCLRKILIKEKIVKNIDFDKRI